jgi:hypothetical protein
VAERDTERRGFKEMKIEQIIINATTTKNATTSQDIMTATIDVPFFLFLTITIIMSLAFTIIFRHKKNGT